MLFLVPAVVVKPSSCTVPMYGVLMAFKDFNMVKGIMGKPMGWFGALPAVF